MPSGKNNPTRDDLLREISRLKEELKRVKSADQRLLGEVIDTIQDGISILNPDLTVRHVNPVMKKWYRANLPLEGRKCFEVYHDRKIPCSPCPTLRCLDSGQPEREIVPGLPGSPAEWLELFSCPMKDPATGEVTGVIEFVRDITDRKRAEDRIRTEHAQLLSLFDSIDQVIYVADMDTHEILFANPATEAIIGRPLVGKTCYREFQGLEKPCGFCTNKIIKNLDYQPYYWEYHNPKLGRDYQIIDRVIKWSDGRDVRFELAIDITDRKRAETSIRENADRYRELSNLLETIFNTIPDILGIQGPDRGIIRYNEAGYKILGVSPEEVVGKKCYQLLGREEPCPVCATKEATRTGQPARVVKFVGEMGRWLDCRAYPVVDGEGKLVQVIEHLRDITDLKKLEEERRELERQVQQSQKLESLGVLAGGIAHDFNNILMVVLGNAELALKTIPDHSPARLHLEEITRAVSQAADLCRQMLAYTGKSSFTRRPVDLKTLVEEIVHLLKASISKKAVLNLQLEENLPPIEADPSQIRQVVMNLLINASEALDGRSGYVTVSIGASDCGEEELKPEEFGEALQPGIYVFLQVTDTGIGMDRETRRRIFEPFFSTKFTGRGLGLPAVLGIVRGHNGAIRIETEPGKGTTFRVFFPALKPGDSSPPAAGAASASGGLDWRGEGTVLLAEDEETLRSLGGDILRRLGLKVLTASDGREAVDLFREHRKEIDLVILDLTMPRLDGGEALAEIRRIDPAARVVIASGYSEGALGARFAGNGLSGILQKPYTLARLRGLLSGLLPARGKAGR